MVPLLARPVVEKTVDFLPDMLRALITVPRLREGAAGKGARPSVKTIKDRIGQK